MADDPAEEGPAEKVPAEEDPVEEGSAVTVIVDLIVSVTVATAAHPEPVAEEPTPATDVAGDPCWSTVVSLGLAGRPLPLEGSTDSTVTVRVVVERLVIVVVGSASE